MSSLPSADFQHTEYASSRPVSMLPGITRRTLAWGERMLLAEFTLLAGGEIPSHAHPHEQIGYLASGRLVFTIGDRRFVVGAGDGYTIPGEVIHSARAEADSVAIEVFSPVREEFK